MLDDERTRLHIDGRSLAETAVRLDAAAVSS